MLSISRVYDWLLHGKVPLMFFLLRRFLVFSPQGQHLAFFMVKFGTDGKFHLIMGLWPISDKILFQHSCQKKHPLELSVCFCNLPLDGATFYAEMTSAVWNFVKILQTATGLV